MNIIVAHPGKQHSYRLASALKKSSMLLKYITTMYDKQNSYLIKFVKLFLSNDNKKRANKRINPDLADSDVVLFCQMNGLLEALVFRLDKTHRIYRLLQRYGSKVFGGKVAKLAKQQMADAVVCYDSNATQCFKTLKKERPSIKRIMDVSIAARPYMHKIYCEEIAKSGNDDLRRENEYMWDEELMRPMQQEIDDTQFFLAASNFVKDSLLYCGVKPEQIKIVPYGANVESSIVRNTVAKGTKIEFLFVGQVMYRKGVPYLFEAMSALDSNEAHLTVTGSYNSNDWFVKNHFGDDNIDFTGLVTLDKMKAIYEKAHVFVLPSFAEGMAQVGIEAMACGLPIICTYNSGVADLVTDGVNGFIIPVGDKQAIVDKMQWFIDHPEKIAEMGEAARKVAANYSWSDYEKRVVKAINEIMES